MAREPSKRSSTPDGAGWWSQASSSLEAMLVRTYERVGHRFVTGLHLWSVGVIVVVFVPLGVFLAGYYEGATAEQYVVSLLVVECATGVCFLNGAYRGRRSRRVLREWIEHRETRPDLAEEAFAAAARVPRDWSVHLALWAAVILPVAATFSIAMPTGHFTVPDVALITLGGWFIIGFGALVSFFGMDLGIVPVRADLSDRLAGRAAHITVLPLTIRLLIGLISLTILGGWFSATFVTEPGSSVAGAAPAFLSSVLVAATLSMLFGVFIAQGVMGPVNQLIRGTRAVAAGDLASRVPVTASDELGVLQVSFNVMVEGLRDREQLRERNVALVEQLRASRARIVAASDSSRRQVERDLHDGAQQYLVLLELKLGLLTKAIAEDPKASALAAEVRADLARALDELRDLAHGIYPAVLEGEGLACALQSAAEQSALPVTIEADRIGRYGPGVEAAVYFCCLEALQNAAKHAGPAAKATVRLGWADGLLTFEVADDGRGYEAADVGPNAGLQNMADRIGALGGELTIESTAGAGTTVRGSVPIEVKR